MDPARRAHYGDFYGAAIHEPVAVVWGNCQAESVRVLLDGSPTFPVRTVRVPPVHELEAEDLGPMGALLPHVVILVAQPVRDGYRGLPIGTGEVATRLAPDAVVARVPIVRYVGLHPYAAIVRHPSAPAAVPPVVPYHDLRSLALAAGRPRGRLPGPATLRSVAAGSVAELARREGGTDLAVSDLLLPSGAGAAHTLNHPGNRILLGLARRVQGFLGLPDDAADPGRQLLGSIRAPVEAEVAEALGLDTPPTTAWTVEGAQVDPDEVHHAHVRWYREHPLWVQGGLDRHAQRMDMLGL
jgi:hypothetical protein